jgi:transposase
VNGYYSDFRKLRSPLLCKNDNLEETIACFDKQIQEYGRLFGEAIQHLDTIPGVARDTAEVIVAEIGIEMSHFPSDAHLAAWDGVALRVFAVNMC